MKTQSIQTTSIIGKGRENRPEPFYRKFREIYGYGLACSLLLAFLLLNCSSVSAQIPGCDPTVPVFNVDMTGVPDSVYYSPPEWWRSERSRQSCH